MTSANLSGQETPSSCEALFNLFGEGVAVYLCQEEPLTGRPSTVVDLAHGDAKVLREGAVTQAELTDILARKGQ